MKSYFAEHYGDIASVIGLIIAIVGFVITIRGVRKAERAAEDAKREASEAIDRLRLQTFLNDVGGSLQLAREILGACRVRSWGVALERCDQTRDRLTRLCENPKLEQERVQLDAAIVTLTSFTHFLVSKKEKAPEKDLSRQKAAELDPVLILLSRIYARLAAELEEG